MKSLNVAYGDARRGFLFTRIKENLIKLKLMKSDMKNWRPTILLFSGNPNTRKSLVDFAVWLEAGRGIIFLANIIPSSVDDFSTMRESAVRQLEKFCREKNIDAFPYVILSENFESAMSSLIQSAGIYPIIPNIVMLGWGPDSNKFVGILRRISLLKKSIIIMKKGNREIVEPRFVDIWWRGKKNGGMMLILAYLMNENNLWNNIRIRLIRVIENESGKEHAVVALQDMIDRARVEAEAHVIVSDKSFPEILYETSEYSDVVFLGFELPDSDYEKWYNSYKTLLDSFSPTVLLVKSSEEENILE
jgi:hypothetical protein